MTRPAEPALPDFATLLDWTEGRLGERAAERVAGAVSTGHPETSATLVWLQNFRSLAQTMPLHSPPPIVRQHLRRHFRRWSQARAALVQAPVRLVASLLFDSRLDLAGAGFRGVDHAENVVHLAYSSDRADLVLDVRRVGPEEVRIDGQVLVEEGEPPVFEASAHGPHGTVRTVDGDDLGRFCLPSVPEDATELRVTNGEVIITAALNLGGAEPQA
ncbi:MAG: hypothetical protein ACLGIF_00825 [Actinomycetes bacterium]